MKALCMCALVLLMGLALTGCFPGDGRYEESKPAGFLSGIWHGWIAPISLIVEIFNCNIRLYEPINTGLWYDVGYYVAIIGGFGSFAIVRRTRSRRRDD